MTSNPKNPARLVRRQPQTETAAFLRWYGASCLVDEQGRPFPVYHGSGDPHIEQFGDRWIWASREPELASDYAEMRREVYGAAALVMPLYMRLERPFNADLLPSTLTAVHFFAEVVRQAGLSGEQAQEVGRLANVVRACARREESGPHYSRHNFWLEEAAFFGHDGARAISDALDVAGFDGVVMTEAGVLTFGARKPEQVKSALGNGGEFSLTDKQLRRSMRAVPLAVGG